MRLYVRMFFITPSTEHSFEGAGNTKYPFYVGLGHVCSGRVDSDISTRFRIDAEYMMERLFQVGVPYIYRCNLSLASIQCGDKNHKFWLSLIKTSRASTSSELILWISLSFLGVVREIIVLVPDHLEVMSCTTPSSLETHFSGEKVFTSLVSECNTTSGLDRCMTFHSIFGFS
jgi:hypothetical protein